MIDAVQEALAETTAPDREATRRRAVPMLQATLVVARFHNEMSRMTLAVTKGEFTPEEVVLQLAAAKKKMIAELDVAQNGINEMLWRETKPEVATQTNFDRWMNAIRTKTMRARAAKIREERQSKFAS